MRSYPKRLIEVDLPIKKISAHARREKSVRHGHISTLHIWWARRPLAACRAVLCAALWPDPADPLCPQRFRDDACCLVNEFATKAASDKALAESCSHDSWKKWQALAKTGGGLDARKEAHWNVLRFALLDFIADFANWDNSTVAEYLETARALTQSAHESLGGAPGTRPLVVDPFAGGGAIPLEALRVGADAFASDLNPVAVLLNKVVLEYIPKYGQRLADQVRRWGKWVREQAEVTLAEVYPADRGGARVIAYLWARTIKCEGPGCGAEVPLIRSLWLAKKRSRSVALRLKPNKDAKLVEFEIVQSPKQRDVGDGTVKLGNATCPCCGYTTPKSYVRGQLRKRRGGADDARLLAVVTTREDESGRSYRLGTAQDAEAIRLATQCWAELPPGAVPDEPVPQERVWKNNPVRIHLYGMTTWGDLFSHRQALALATLSRLVRECPVDGDVGLRVAVQACIALAVSRCADKCANTVVWHIPGEKVEHVFGRQALPMVWDFAEANILGDVGWEGAVEWVRRVVETTTNARLAAGHAERADAATHPLPDDSADAFITDPPYYEAVPYATLSDFFYVWLKRSLPPELQGAFAGELVEKDAEIVVDEAKNKDHTFYESKMTEALASGRRYSKSGAIGTVVFAHKSTSGWEAMLQAMLDAGWIITASWPIDTEMGARLRARDSATLASSVHLVCRPREDLDGASSGVDIGDWRDVLAELPRRIHDWMPRLAHVCAFLRSSVCNPLKAQGRFSIFEKV
jgi:adenine-specific DNA methylase